MTNKNLVHEADSQRHHVRVKLPAKMEIKGTIIVVEDWSVAGARVILATKDDAQLLKTNKVYDAKLIFDLESFALDVPMRVEVCHEEDSSKDTSLGVRFVDMTQEQIVIMQQLVSSYVAGDISAVGDLIHVMSRNNFSKARQIPSKENVSLSEKVSSWMKNAAVVAVSLILFAYVALSIFENKYLITADRSYVTADGVAVTSPSGGIVNFKKIYNGDKVKKGAILATIQSDTGNVVGVDSPCDCVIQEIKTESGSAVGKGSVIIRMTELNSPLYVQAFVSFENATRLRNGQAVKIELDNSKIIRAKIRNITALNNSDLASVLIKPDEPIPAEMLGLPVAIKVNTYKKVRK